jgi:hypothetical protein
MCCDGDGNLAKARTAKIRVALRARGAIGVRFATVERGLMGLKKLEMFFVFS